MAKKGGAAQLQQEISTDEEWEKLLEKEGLIVVDVYSEWCGPCSAMLANLKKIKLEMGGDTLQLAVAKSDTISDLERFRTKSEPTWMFISNGKVVNLMFGANAPKLMDLVIQELKRYTSGVGEEAAWEITELSPEERVRYEEAKAIEDEAIRVEIERRQQQLLERRTAVANVVLQHAPSLGVIIVFPQAKELYKVTLSDLWEPAGLQVSATEKPHFTEAMVEELLYFAETQFSEVDIVNLLSAQTFALLVKSSEGEDFNGDIEEVLLEFIYGESKCPPGSPESPAEQLIGHIPVPKEVQESVTALETIEESIANLEKNLAIPSMLSLSGLNAESTKNLNASKAEVRSQLEELSKTIIRSKMGLTSKDMMFSKSSIRGGQIIEEEEEEVFLDVSGIWAPPNAFTKATAIKLLFPKIYDPIALPEPVPTPPHIAIAFDAFRRQEVVDLMNEYKDDILRYGFFTSDNPESAELVTKTVTKYERTRATATKYGEKLVIQLSRKRSEPWCVFSQLNPTFMSHTPADGELHCKMFFPEGYDEPEEEDVEEDDGKNKKGKKDESVERVESKQDFEDYEATESEDYEATESETAILEEGSEAEEETDEN